MNCEQGFGVYNCSTVVVTRLAINQNTLVMRAKQRGDVIRLKKYANVGERINLLYGSFIWRGHSTVTEEIGRKDGGRIRIEMPFPSATKGGLNSFQCEKGGFNLLLYSICYYPVRVSFFFTN